MLVNAVILNIIMFMKKISRKYLITKKKCKKNVKKNAKKMQFSKITECGFRAVSTLLTTL